MPGSHESKLPELVLAPESGQFFYASQFRQEAIISGSLENSNSELNEFKPAFN